MLESWKIMGTLQFKNINKIYPNGVQAVYDFEMDVNEGEFIVLVGPSGCGKSTTLRMIAGLEEISSGELLIGDQIVNDVAPKDRDIAMVFQNYALYAHMSVYHNMAFSLILRKESSDTIHERVLWAADILGLVPYLKRRPKNLSGGQRQRVALGRAIVRNPKVFLLDEPLSNLDAKLRGVMRKELKKLHHRLGTTMVYVTHAQIEALTLADRIVIMNEGYVQQIGTPYEIYHDPKNIFVANFIGTPPMNTFTCELTQDGAIKTGDILVDIKKHKIYNRLVELNYVGKELVMGIRPEHIDVEEANETKKQFTSKVDLFELYGAEATIHFDLAGKDVIAKTSDVLSLSAGQMIRYNFDIDHIYFFDKETELRIK